MTQMTQISWDLDGATSFHRLLGAQVCDGCWQTCKIEKGYLRHPDDP